MGSLSSETSSDTSTDTSTSDSASNASPLPRTNANTIEATGATANGAANGAAIETDDEESDSDVSMSADSDDDEDNSAKATSNTHNIVITQPKALIAGVARLSEEGSSRKRRFSDSTPSMEDRTHNGLHNEGRKRLRAVVEGKLSVASPKTPKEKSFLPAEIWHQIFTFCPPRVLGQLLTVNKSFHSSIGIPPSNFSVAQPKNSSLKLLSPDEIWRASRKRFLPGAPGPLTKSSELTMWKLACGNICQFCNKRGEVKLNASKDQWHSGPGQNGVSPIWNFGVRTCGSCLKENSLTEFDLLTSSVFPSLLMVALPLVFLTNELHVIPTTTLQAGQQPVNIQITKLFSKRQVEDIIKEFEGVKALGSAATEEWLKGLDGLGKARKNDAARWERWEAGGGLLKMRNDTQDITKSKTTIAASLPPKPLGLPSANSFAPHQPTMLTQQTAPTPSYPGQPMPIPTHDTNPPRFDSPVLYGLLQYPPPPRTQSRQIKTKEDVAEIKAARRAEIERRCMAFDPPLTAGVIAHMASFQAALHILKPLDERDWEILKPRLLAQREEAEHRENDRLAQTRVVQERLDERRIQDSQTRSDSKDLVDREWEDIQAPLRARISGYADEIIRDGWNGGDKVNTENCPLFAAEVLIYVRKRFYAEIAKDEAALRATGRQPEIDPPHGPFTRKLILENMKWVFDTKIKPLTEPHRKELFLCNDCEFITKYYGFEGIIQHFAAKHTNSLSMGSVVVHWKSEWPEHPPFNPDPNGVKPYFGTAPSASVPYANPVPQPMQQQNYGYGGYQPAPLAAPVLQSHLSQGYQPSPSPYYGQSHFPPYSGHQNGPFAPPPYPDVSQSYQHTQYSAAPGQNNNGYGDYSYNAPYIVPAQGGYETSQAQAYPPTYDTSAQPGYATQNGQYGQSYNQPSSYPAPSYPVAPLVTEQYKAQLQQLAHDARDVWNRIQSVKEVPGSVKVCTVIYHVLSRFRAMFQEDPSLAMLVDGLSNNKDMRPVRNINGLVCKACSQGMPGFVSASNKKHFSFPQLASHFHLLHEGVSPSGTGPIPDWTKDMVELPDHSKLALVATAPGIDDHKLKLFAEALPEITAPPLPVDPSYSNEEQYYPAEPEPYMELAPSRDNHASYYTTTDSSKQEAVNTPYDNGEYDPRNPRDIIVDPQSFHKPSLGNGQSREIEPAVDRQPVYRYAKEEEEPRRISYQERPDRSYVEPRPMSSYQSGYAVDYGRSQVHEEAPIYVERPVRYQDEEEVEYRARQNQPVTYEDPIYETRDYRAENQRAHSNRQELQPLSAHEVFRTAQRLPVVEDDPASQQNRIFEVVAQIQQQAKVVQDREHARKEHPDAGSEDGEVRAEGTQSLARERQPVFDTGDRAAERFLDEFRPERAPQAGIKIEGAGRPREDFRPRWEPERENVYRPEPERQMHREYEDDQPSNGRLVSLDDRSQNGRMYARATSRQSRAYAYEDRYVNSVPDRGTQRERSPELVDRRYKLNNVVYRDERQGSARHTPSRYARYESVRLENERERSRSPVYVKMSAQPAPYRERSMESIYRPQSVVPAAEEPIYRPRSAIQAVDGLPYERPPPRQQEYVRVYADEPRPQYTETFEYVRVADPAGDYMIRRPVRQPVYERYDERQRRPIYDSHGARQGGAPPTAGAYEEYDPRHPETVANANA